MRVRWLLSDKLRRKLCVENLNDGFPDHPRNDTQFCRGTFAQRAAGLFQIVAGIGHVAFLERRRAELEVQPSENQIVLRQSTGGFELLIRVQVLATQNQHIAQAFHSAEAYFGIDLFGSAHRDAILLLSDFLSVLLASLFGSTQSEWKRPFGFAGRVEERCQVEHTLPLASVEITRFTRLLEVRCAANVRPQVGNIQAADLLDCHGQLQVVTANRIFVEMIHDRFTHAVVVRFDQSVSVVVIRFGRAHEVAGAKLSQKPGPFVHCIQRLVRLHRGGRPTGNRDQFEQPPSVVRQPADASPDDFVEFQRLVGDVRVVLRVLGEFPHEERPAARLASDLCRQFVGRGVITVEQHQREAFGVRFLQ